MSSFSRFFASASSLVSTTWLRSKDAKDEEDSQQVGKLQSFWEEQRPRSPRLLAADGNELSLLLLEFSCSLGLHKQMHQEAEQTVQKLYIICYYYSYVSYIEYIG